MKTEIATFAAGCFWGVEEVFARLPGVLKTTVGYSGGTKENPTYEEVCSSATGHAEAVRIEFNPEQISYQDLLKTFWDNHNPTQVNRQGPDIGTQYRSVIFYHSPEQKNQAEASKQAMEASHRYSEPIATQILPAAPFYNAEEYHQKYLQKHGLDSCHI